jgi:acetyl-CoA carboxylase carboxyltransferase component
MSWQSEVDELNRRAAMARAMGGPESVAFHKSRGKLTVRERIDILGDAGSFREGGLLAGTPDWDGINLKKLTPANSVAGYVKLDGRKAMVLGGDFTIRGGAADASIADKGQWSLKQAYTNRIPFIRLLDAAGGSVRTFEKIGRTYLSTADRTMEYDILQRVPCVSAVLGSAAGLPAIYGVFCHFNIMVKGTSQLFAGGPPVVKAGLGIDIDKEALGGVDVHVRHSGVIANVAEDEVDAFRQIKRFLSYLPQNVWQMPPRTEPAPPAVERSEELLSLVPRNPRQVYDARKLIDIVIDRESFFEIQPLYGRSRITAFARVNGYPVGVMANNCKFLGGALDVAASDKVGRFLQICDMFHLPIIYFCDEPGFMVGEQSERDGIIRKGARTLGILNMSQVPYLTFVIRQVYGVAGGLNHRGGGTTMYRRYAWPSGNWGSMHITGGVSAAYRAEIEAAPDPVAKRAEIEARLGELASPFRTAHAGQVDIIDPRTTRALMEEFVEDAQEVLRSQLGQTSRVPFLP